jgi:hypothetical protein
MPGRSATNVTSGSSFATVRHRLFSAALLALYGAQPAVAPIAEPELVNTTRPPRERSAGIAACSAVTSEKKLTSKCTRHASTVGASCTTVPSG